MKLCCKEFLICFILLIIVFFEFIEFIVTQLEEKLRSVVYHARIKSTVGLPD
jgi:hypothetical protein